MPFSEFINRYLLRVYRDGAPEIKYDPGTPGDWAPVPDDVKEALDQLRTEVSSDSSHFFFGSQVVASSTTTRYLPPGFDNFTAPTSPVAIVVPRAGTLRNLFVRQNSPTGNGNPVVYTVRVGGSPTALTASVSSLATAGSDTVNTVPVAQGSHIDIEVTKAASIGGSGSLNVTVICELV